jgi:hypothetical protein
MNKFIIFFIVCVFTTGCTTTKYVEKQSEELSQAVYATKDSLDSARLDLAEKYSIQSTKLVVPPKNRIKINPLIRSNKGGNQTERVVVLPTSNKNDKVIVVGSPEYDELIQDKRIAEQLKQDVFNWESYSKEVDRKLIEQYAINNEMIVKIQELEKDILKKDKKLLEKDLAILWRNITILSLLGVMGVGVYLRIKGIL